jgi:outer membrane immunogenic protein
MNASTPYNGYNGFPVQDLNDGSLAGGLQIGYNKQMGALGLGAEAAMSFTGQKRQSTTNDPGTLFWRESNFNATIGPRVSIATPGMIFYGKGGLAIGKYQVGHNQNGTLISADQTTYGYMLGGGAELALSSKLSVGVQYEYLDFGKSEIHVVSPNSDIFLQPGSKVHNLKAVMNYRF